MPSVTILLSGPQDRLSEAQTALEAAGLRICPNVDPKGVPHPQHAWGHPDGHLTEWSGQRYQQGDIDALDEANPGHGHAVGDIVPGTGSLVPKDPDEPVTFITVEGEHLRGWDEDGGAHMNAPSRAQAAVEPLGWILRAHWGNDQDIAVVNPDDELSPEERMARVERDMALLRKGR